MSEAVQNKDTKTKILNYLKECFSKKNIIEKGIIAAAALILVLAFSLSFYFWLKDVNPGTEIGANGFWYIYITWNSGVGWSALSGNSGAIYAIQSIMFVLLLAVFLFASDNKIISSFVALAMFGGLFNLIQRAASGTDAVLDYFIFGFWKTFPIFNWPDMFVVIGIFGFIISYVIFAIIEAAQQPKDSKNVKEQDEKQKQ